MIEYYDGLENIGGEYLGYEHARDHGIFRNYLVSHVSHGLDIKNRFE